MNQLVAMPSWRRKGPIVALLFLIVAAVIGYTLFRPPASTYKGPAMHTFAVAVHANDPGDQLPVFSLQEGDSAEILVLSKTPGMLMVHGFEDMPNVTPDHPAKFNLRADKTGRFSLHLHTNDGRQIEVAVIEIRPRN